MKIEGGNIRQNTRAPWEIWTLPNVQVFIHHTSEFSIAYPTACTHTGN